MLVRAGFLFCFSNLFSHLFCVSEQAQLFFFSFLVLFEIVQQILECLLLVEKAGVYSCRPGGGSFTFFFFFVSLVGRVLFVAPAEPLCESLLTFELFSFSFFF